jgi:hypothetical protein
VIRQIHRDTGQRYGSRVHAALRTQGSGSCRGRILIARSLQNIATSYAVSVYERFQFERRVFEDDESACEKDAMDNQTCIADPCEFDVPCACAAIAVVGRW